MSNRHNAHASDHVWSTWAGNRRMSLYRNGDYTGLVVRMQTGNGKAETGRTMQANEIAKLIADLSRELAFIANRGTEWTG